MTTAYDNILWPEPAFCRIPYALYSNPEIHALEQQRVFRGATWNFVGLECEIPKIGDYKTNFIGDTPVVMVRARDGGVNVLLNRCAHRGNLVCYKASGNANKLTCVYHNWTYDLDGTLKGVAFQKGVNGKGGMPGDFQMSAHNMRRLRSETYAGLVFATFSANVAPLGDYLGAEMRQNIDRVLGRKLRLIGYYSQFMPNDWKFYVENNKDPYHASLLHLFQTTFRLNRLSMKGGIKLSADGWHHISYSIADADSENAEYSSDKLRAVADDYTLADPSLMKRWNEFPCGTTLAIQTIYPNFVVQQISNSLAVRLCLPKGDGCELLWWVLGTDEDTPEQRDMRIRQSNMIGPGGVISMEDGVVGGWIQRATKNDRADSTFVEMGGRDIAGTEDSRATETAIRGFWRAYRQCMESPPNQ